MPTRSSFGRSRGLLAVLSLCATGPVFAQTPAPAAQEKEAVAGAHYRASGLHKLFFGADYRDLWTTPVKVEVLDLGSFAGGLQPVRRVGGQQTKGLALKGYNGRAYTFRGVDKDPSSVLPPDLQGTFADRIVQDQIAAGHPAAAVVVTPILEAAAILHVNPRLVVMPDDPRLGAFQADFAGLLGTIEEYPQAVSDGAPGFAGATEIIGGEELWKRLKANPDDRVDDRAFLTARLVDIFMGDWDRHLKQWRWVRTPEQPRWRPIPEDRDQAFSRYEGLLLSIARFNQPRFVNFGDEYPSMVGLTYNGWDVDRRLLVSLEKPVWDETAASLVQRITDDVIDSAVRRLPPEYARIDGPRLAAALKKRRDRLPEAAERFYRQLADKVTVQATDQAETAEVVHLDGGDVEVRISPGAEGTTGGEPYFQRRFRRGETREVRLYLYGGNDRVVTRGSGGDITLRVVGGDGYDTVDDSAGGGTRFSDSAGNNKVVPGPGTKTDSRTYVPPPENPTAPWIPPRDWGRKTVPIVWLSGGPDVGAFLGGGIITQGYAFRKDPYGNRQMLRAGYATGAQAIRADYEGEFRRSNSGVYSTLAARASGIDILRFYGFGNETSSAGADDFFKVEQQHFSLEPSLTVPFARHFSLTFGPRVSFASTQRDQDLFITRTSPYGSEDFGQVGATATLRLDTRDSPVAARRGFHVWVTGRYNPELWDVKSAFGSVHGEASTFVTAPGYLRPTLAVRAGGQRVWGTYPFHEAAFVGGSSTVRGFRSQRFAGDASLYGSAELRIFLTRFFLLLPGEFGVFGLADAGRVYLEGESSDRWHTAVGGGFWFAYLDRTRTISVSVAKSAERTGLYVRAGFVF